MAIVNPDHTIAWQTALKLASFAFLALVLVVGVHWWTAGRIAANERQLLLRQLQSLISPQQYDNDILATATVVQSPLLGDQPAMRYEARYQGRLQAVLLTPSTRQGYHGRMRLLVGIQPEGALIGVRILSHQETPGFADELAYPRFNWVLGFDGRSVQNPMASGWEVKKAGGVFDQFTGATITPRAVIKAVYQCLLYMQSQN